MVNEPLEESLLGDVPAVSDAQWDSMLSSTFSAPPGFADYLVDMFDSVTEDGSVPDAPSDETDTTDDDAIDPDAIDDIDEEGDGSTDAAETSDEGDADSAPEADSPASDDGYVDADPADALPGAGETADSSYDDSYEAGYDEHDDYGNDDIDMGDLGL